MPKVKAFLPSSLPFSSSSSPSLFYSEGDALSFGSLVTDCSQRKRYFEGRASLHHQSDVLDFDVIPSMNVALVSTADGRLGSFFSLTKKQKKESAKI